MSINVVSGRRTAFEKTHRLTVRCYNGCLPKRRIANELSIHVLDDIRQRHSGLKKASKSELMAEIIDAQLREKERYGEARAISNDRAVSGNTVPEFDV